MKPWRGHGSKPRFRVVFLGIIGILDSFFCFLSGVEPISWLVVSCSLPWTAKQYYKEHACWFATSFVFLYVRGQNYGIVYGLCQERAFQGDAFFSFSLENYRWLPKNDTYTCVTYGDKTIPPKVPKSCKTIPPCVTFKNLENDRWA